MYFDPVKKQYSTRSVGRLTVDVISPPPQKRMSTQRLTEDSAGPQLQSIREITRPDDIHSTQDYGLLVQVTLFGAPLLFLGLLGYERFAHRRSRTAGSRSARGAAGKAQKALAGLDMNRSTQDVYSELHVLATTYLDHRFQISTRGKTYAQLRTILSEHGIPGGRVEDFVNELEMLELARFTGMDQERGPAESRSVIAAGIQGIEESLS